MLPNEDFHADARRAARALARDVAVVDVAFALSGGHLPRGYAFALDEALEGCLPWLADEPAAGVHPLRAAETEFGLVLARRTRLVLRVPASRVADAYALCGRRLELGDAVLTVGVAAERPVVPFATLRASMVASEAGDEAGFTDDVGAELERLGVRARLICGRRTVLDNGRRRLAGFALALHELSPSHSLRLQAHGLGPARRLGCGVFVHHKIIEGLGVEPD